MALAASTPLATFDQADGEFLDLSNELAEIIRRDNTSFLSRIGISGQATETKHSWMEDKLNANTAITLATADGVIDASAVAVTVASGLGTRFQIGTLFKDTAAGKTEVIQVTAITGDVLTIVRGYGSTSGQTHGTGTTPFNIQIIAHPKQEGQDPSADESKARTKVSNYVQIFQKGINVSYSMRKVLQAGVADEYTFQVARRLMEIMRELDSCLINGISSGSQGSDSVYRSMGGIVEFSSQALGNITTTAEPLTLTVINDMCKQIWDDGGVPNFILVGGKQKRAINTFDQSARRSVYDATTAGYVVDKVITDLGFILDVIVDPWVPDDVCIVGDLNKIKVVPFIPMMSEDVAKSGAAYKGQVYGEYTAEFRNALEAFSYHNSLT